MSKKLIMVVLAVLLIVPSSLFAVDLIGLRVGPTAMLNGTVNEETDFSEVFENLELENFTFGADVRMNFTLLEVNALATVSEMDLDAKTGTVEVYTNAGVSVPLLSIFRFGVTAGPKFEFAYDADGFTGSEDNPEDVLEAKLNLRGTADLVLGDLSVGLTGIMTTPHSINDVINDNVEDFTAMFDSPEVQVGVSVLFAIF